MTSRIILLCCNFLRLDCESNITVLIKRTYSQQRPSALAEESKSFLHYNRQKLIRNSNFLLLFVPEPVVLTRFKITSITFRPTWGLSRYCGTTPRYRAPVAEWGLVRVLQVVPRRFYSAARYRYESKHRYAIR